MILGVVFGTLSSIFIASPVAYMVMGRKIENRLEKKEEE
jgi:SecD/SecF fusion protein